MHTTKPNLHTAGLSLALSALFAVACATVRPDFQRNFHSGRASHDLWMSLLMDRYGCDTALVVASMPRRDPGVGLSSLLKEPSRRLQVGMAACDVASLVAPEVIAAWVTPEGIREEWKFRPDPGLLTSVYLEGRQGQSLRVVAPLPQSAR